MNYSIIPFDQDEDEYAQRDYDESQSIAREGMLEHMEWCEMECIPARDTVKPVRIPSPEELEELAAELEDLANFTMEF